jgi:hypothetical protein
MIHSGQSSREREPEDYYCSCYQSYAAAAVALLLLPRHSFYDIMVRQTAAAAAFIFWVWKQEAERLGASPS